MNLNKNVKFVLGKAGTGKTTSILKSLMELNNSVLCLAYTHSAVENLKNKSNSKLKGTESKKKQWVFMTIHKYLKLPINKIIYRKIANYEIYDYIVIDEISLIPLDIINILFNLSNYFINTKFIFIGDLLQLPSIRKEKTGKKLSFLKNDKFDKPLNISLNESIKILSYLNDTVYFNDYYNNSDKLILTYNYRNDIYVQGIINEVMTDSKNILKYIITAQDLNTGQSPYNDYIKLASRYKYLKTLYTLSNNYNKNYKIVKSKIGDIYIKNGDLLVANENIEDMELVNGEIYKINNVDDEILMFNIGKFLPYNYLTIHKSQGKTLNKIIICINDLFEISMFYTALTRAQTDIKFICFGNIETELKNINDNNKLFKILNNIIYE